MGARDGKRLRLEFVAEAEGILETAATTLETLGGGRSDPPPELVNAFFRSVHSLKGLASMAGFPGVSAMAHRLESLLDAVRMGRVPLDRPTQKAARAAFTSLTDLVSRASRGEDDPQPKDELGAIFDEALLPRAAVRVGPVLAIPEALDRLLTAYERHRLDENARKGRQILLLGLDLSFDTFDVALRTAMKVAEERGELIGTFPGTSASPDRMAFRLLAGFPADADAAEIGRAAQATVERLDSAAPAALPAAAPLPSPFELPAAPGSLRVPLPKVTALLDLAGEASLALHALRQPLAAALAQVESRTLKYEIQRAIETLEKAVTGVGRAALAVRLVPVEQLATRLGRALEGIMPALGKEATFEVVGGETEIDKILADQLADPLLHLMRNALDHGIESPAEREAARKERCGRITLAAAAKGRDVLVTLSDDGRGIDSAVIVARAREKGILGPEEPVPADPFSLLFRPGFSTADRVSELSGRGVGLDVVRSNIAAVKGTVNVRSTVAVGTVFEIVVPITLALVESVLVRAGGRFFAFPASSVLRMRFAGGPHDTDRTALPTVRLDDLLGIEPERVVPGVPEIILVAGQGDESAGFIVSSVEGMRDILVKPLGPELPRAREVTGVAELPDGDLALTLDTGLLVERVRQAAAVAGQAA